MIQHIARIILQFKECFKREKTWEWFLILILGFMLRFGNVNRGITQVISTLRLKPAHYHTMLNYFRSTAYNVPALYSKWIEVAQQETEFLKVEERIVLLGDHIKIPKEGRRMPGIQIIHQESQNSGKGEYIEGHIHAQVAALVSGSGTTRSIPLMTERQQSPPKKADSKKPDGDTLVTQMVNLVTKCAGSLEEGSKAVAALDAYYAKASAFLAADKAVNSEGERILEIVTRGRDDSTAYYKPGPRKKGQPGRTRKYGKKVVLWNLFSDKSKFSETTLCLYGKPTEVKFRCMDLIWRPLGHERLVRFVLVESKLGRMILMCSDLTLKPEDIIVTFGYRFKIETSFDEQKNNNGCFSYHFWTKALPKRKRWEKNNHMPQTDSPELVDAANRAIDSFLCLGTISTGILTIIAFSHNREIWKRYPGWIRTLRSKIPTIAVVKETLAQIFHIYLQLNPHAYPFCIVNERQRLVDFLYDDAV